MRVVVVVCLVSMSSSARADDLAKVPDHELGDRGQYILTSDTRLDASRESYSYTDSDGMEVDRVHFRFHGRIAIDRAFYARFTAGLHIGFESDIIGDDSYKAVTLGGRLGHIAPLGKKVHVWPRVGLTYSNATYGFNTLSGPADVTAQIVRGEVSCPILWNPVARLVLGVGPFLWRDVFANVARDAPIAKTTTVGVQGVIGGWFHGF